mgnify:CR=1 FL=1
MFIKALLLKVVKMSKIANMLNMIQILKDKKIHSIQSLAEKLEEAGIYIDSVTGKYGGYKIDDENKFLGLNNVVKEEMYILMKKAIKNKNKVYIVYKSINSGITNRIIHPAELFCYIDKWYVAAFCELRNEIRLFKLENILEYNVLEDKYENKNNCDKNIS